MKVSLSNISKKYGSKVVLDDVSLELKEGVHGLLGTNGAGKTTLINILMGVTSKNRGRICIDGQDIKDMGRSFLSCVGYLPQAPLFYKDFTVAEFLRYMGALKGMDKDVCEKRIPELLEIVNLIPDAGKKIGALSGGMRQRVGIAQAVLNDPGILILDEPTAGLDPRERIRFRNLITQFSEGKVVVLATHIVSDVEYIANNIILLHEGKLVKTGDPKQLEDEMDGRVWELSLNDSDVPVALLHNTISNVTRQETGIRMRIVSETRPHEAAVKVKPNMDEVFLYHCGEDPA
ncbi:MAG: ABC transporter ATP-binding protein [Lachnospiraceae bacterium]|nr:ABC transporter ATP-binding protein [Lachnospiraceae bacterium]